VAARVRAFIIIDVASARLRLAPPLVLTEEQAASFVAAWPRILDVAFAAEAS